MMNEQHRAALLDKVQFIKADLSHASRFPECLALVDRTQGIGILQLDHFGKCVSAPDRILLLALLQGELIGVATACLLPSDGSTYYEAFGKESVELLFSHHKVGSMDFASVEERWQGQGIGFELGRQRVAWLQQMGCNAIVGISWESGRRSSDRVFLGLGFDRFSRVEDFYVEISRQRGFICPVCGPPPCRCAASLYVKHVGRYR